MGLLDKLLTAGAIAADLGRQGMRNTASRASDEARKMAYEAKREGNTQKYDALMQKSRELKDKSNQW